MKVLFDHNVPRKLRRVLQEHDVRTAVEMGWAELENGDLLRAADLAGFEVMVTGDENLSYQQNLEGRSLALVVLSTNNWNILKLEPEKVAAAVGVATKGSFQRVVF